VTALLLAAALGALTSPIETEHQRSREAREHLAARQAEPALRAYRALEAELGARPEIEVGRGAALLSGGREGEAAEAFGRARSAPEPLGSRALLGLGTALAGKGELDGAIAAYREALQRDPDYAEARQDLEVVLRRKAARPEQQQRETQQADPQPGRKPAGGAPAEPKPGGEPQPAPEPEPGRPGTQQPERPSEPPGERPSRDEAIRLLDAMRAREQNLPEGARNRVVRRGDAEKDW